MDPLDFLEVADEWATGNREAEWRSAVSRAYYAAFHVAWRLLRQAGFAVPQSEQAHAYLWLRLVNSGHTDVQQAGDDLKDLRRLRNRADYKLDQPFAQSLALSNVPVASTIIRLLQDVAKTPLVLGAITDAMRIYERDVLGQVTWQP